MSTKGSITSRKDKNGRHVSWLVKYEAPRDPDKPKARQQRYETVRGKRSAAQALLNKRLREIDTGEFVNPESITLKEWAAHWLENVAPKRAKAGRTRERYGELLECYLLPKLGGTALQKLSSAAIDKAYAELEAGGGRGGKALSARTVHHCHRLLSEILRAAVKARKVPRNACEAASPPGPDASPASAFSLEEINRILADVDGTSIGPLVRLALATGARRGELAGLRWSDVDLEARTVSIARSVELVGNVVGIRLPKTEKSRRTIRLGDAEITTLRAMWKEQAELALKLGIRLPSDAYLFPLEPDQPMTPINPDRLTGRFNTVLERVGIKRRGLSLHSLRHSSATLLLRGGIDLKTVSSRLGHSTVKLTGDVYAHVMADMDQRAGDLASAIINGATRTKKE